MPQVVTKVVQPSVFVATVGASATDRTPLAKRQGYDPADTLSLVKKTDASPTDRETTTGKTSSLARKVVNRTAKTVASFTGISTAIIAGSTIQSMMAGMTLAGLGVIFGAAGVVVTAGLVAVAYATRDK